MLSRRRFLSILGAAPLAGTALRAAPEAGTDTRPPTLINRFSIAGFQYYDGPDNLRALAPGDRLTLRAEPDNPHDEFAVRILCGPLALGYVPRSDNRHISRLLLDGTALQARIESVFPQNPLWRAVRVEVFLSARSASV